MIKDQSETKNNVYVIADIQTKKAAIIDPGCSMEQIEELLTRYQLELKTVFVTHTHEDHIRCINELVDQYACDVYVSKIEAEYYSFTCQSLHMFENNDSIKIGKTKVECIITPGHTRGSSCFLIGDSLFTGDTIFIEGCGACTYRGASAESMFYSVRRIKTQINNKVLVYPGHTYSIAPGRSLESLNKCNIYFCIYDKQDFINFRMRKNQKNLYNFT